MIGTTAADADADADTKEFGPEELNQSFEESFSSGQFDDLKEFMACCPTWEAFKESTEFKESLHQLWSDWDGTHFTNCGQIAMPLSEIAKILHTAVDKVLLPDWCTIANQVATILASGTNDFSKDDSSYLDQVFLTKDTLKTFITFRTRMCHAMLMEMLGPLKVPTQPQLCRANVNKAIVEFLDRVAAIESCQKEHEWSQWWTSLLETVAHDRDVGAFLQGGGDCDPAEQSPKEVDRGGYS